MKKGSHHSEWTKKILREANLGKHHSETTRKEMSMSRMGHFVSETTRLKISKSHIGIKPSDKTRKKMSDTRKGKFNAGTFKKGHVSYNKGKHPAEETIQKMRDIWKDEEFAKKMMVSFHIKPNGMELYLDFLLQNYFPDEWKFVGDGKIFVDGLCPDFINVNGQKKIIELFGEYWHKKKKNIRYNYTEEGRKETFSRYGYSTLIIWEPELSDEKKVIEKIRGFSK